MLKLLSTMRAIAVGACEVLFCGSRAFITGRASARMKNMMISILVMRSKSSRNLRSRDFFFWTSLRNRNELKYTIFGLYLMKRWMRMGIIAATRPMRKRELRKDKFMTSVNIFWFG